MTVHNLQLNRSVTNSAQGFEPMNGRSGRMDFKTPAVDATAGMKEQLQYIPGGEFRKNPEAGGNQVNIEPFFMAICPVTNQEYEQFDPEHKKRRDIYSSADDEPVVYVSWDDANRYCQWLSQKNGSQYRLPLEDEWEYACRAGSARQYSLDHQGMEVTDATLKDYVVYNSHKTMPVKQRKPNFYGLYDMHGNVWEWCQDDYDHTKTAKVLRGGSWFSPRMNLQASFRGGYNPENKKGFIGFRVVCAARNQ